jgi:citrate lyase subunit beta/citryl-CoA lyase
MTSPRDLPVWRSLLFVPVNVERFVESAHRRDADVIQLDLEDSVPPSEKDRARTLVPAAAAKVARGGAEVVVRINRPLAMAVRDIEASVCPGVACLALPKVTSADHIRLLAEHTAEVEAKQGMAIGTTRFIAMVETADAWFRMREIAGADPRVVALTLGAEDFATSVGMLPEPEGLLAPKQAMVIAAAAAGVLPLGFVGSIAGYKDLDGFRQIIRRSRALGFRGAGCIHPDQARILNEEFAPQPDELAHATRVVEAYAAAQREGRGAISIDGRMIDVPVVERAQALLDWQARISARKERRAGRTLPVDLPTV